MTRDGWHASPEARTRLYLSYRANLLAYINTLVGDPHLAEDIFQDVGVVVLTQGENLRAPEAFRSWLRSVARNKAVNRATKRTPLSLDAAVLESLEAHWEEPQPEEESLDALRQCVAKLSGKQRELLDYRYGKEIGGKRLAELLGRPVNTIYGTLSRVHRALGACVRRQVAGGGRLEQGGAS